MGGSVYVAPIHPHLRINKCVNVNVAPMNSTIRYVRQFGMWHPWERDSLLSGTNGADGITWVITRVVSPTTTPFVGAYVQKDRRGPLNCSILDNGDFCLNCVASNEWDRLAPHVSSGPQPERTEACPGRADLTAGSGLGRDREIHQPPGEEGGRACGHSVTFCAPPLRLS